MCSLSIAVVAEKPLVSIAIVAHNNWPELGLAIETSLGQTWPGVEVVVIDNDSRDATEAEVQRRYAGRVKYVRQANRLDGGGYNRGIAESKGNFVQLLDGDDLLALDKIELQMSVFAARPEADIVYGEAREFSGDPGNAVYRDWETKQESDMLMTLIDPAGKGAGLVIHSPLFRRSALERVGQWDESLFGADMDYWLRAAWAGMVFVFSPGAWCYHRRRSGQMSANTVAMVNRAITTLEKALTYIDREPYRSALRKRLAALQYGRALTDISIGSVEARNLLKRSREIDSSRISPAAYALARAVLAVPGARRITRSKKLASLRARVALALGVTD